MNGHKKYHQDFADAVCGLLFGDTEKTDITDRIIFIEEHLNVASNLMTEYPSINCTAYLNVNEDEYKLIKETYEKSDNHLIIGNKDDEFTICKFCADEYRAQSEIDIVLEDE
jgi:hypothetical protein